MADRPYVRVYYSVIDDPRFATIYPHDGAFALWLRLLLLADAMYPAPAPLPTGVKPASVRLLIEAGVVETLPGNHFRMHGLASERSRRAERARIGGRANAERLLSERSATAIPSRARRRDETSIDETSRADARAAEDDEPEGEAITWLAVHGCYVRPGNGYHRQLIATVEHHGINAVIGMFDRLAKGGTTDGDIKGFIFGAKDALDARTRPDLTVVAKEEERAEDRSRREAASKRQLAELGRYIDEEPMPEEQRTANLARLRSEMAAKGLIS